MTISQPGIKSNIFYCHTGLVLMNAIATQDCIHDQRFDTQRAVYNLYSSKSALAEHVCKTSHKIAWEDSKIITTNNRYGQRLCLEAWHINASSCALNRDDGSYLPQEYLHLVGK